MIDDAMRKKLLIIVVLIAVGLVTFSLLWFLYQGSSLCGTYYCQTARQFSITIHEDNTFRFQAIIPTFFENIQNYTGYWKLDDSNLTLFVSGANSSKYEVGNGFLIDSEGKLWVKDFQSAHEDPYYSFPPYQLVIQSNIGGSTTPSAGTYIQNTRVNITVVATPSTRYKFDYWLLDGANAGTNSPITVQIAGNHTLQAFFRPIQYQPYLAVAMFDNGVAILNVTTLEKINYTSAPLPLVPNYVLASDEHFLYVGFAYSSVSSQAKIRRINNDGSYNTLDLPGYTHIHKLWVQLDLFALVSNDQTGEIAILNINVTSYAISRSVILSGIAGRPTDIAVTMNWLYMTAFNVSASANYLAKIDAALSVTSVASVPAGSPAKICLSGETIFLRCSDSVLKFSKDLTFISKTPGIFGYGGLAVVGDKLAVAGYNIGVGSPCVYWLDQNTLEVVRITSLSNSIGNAFQITTFGNSTLVGIWEAQVGSSVVNIASDGHVTKQLVSDDANAWPVDLLFFEIGS